MSEAWKPVPGWPEYEASACGQVRRAETGKIRKTPPDAQGYLHVSLTRPGKRETCLVHRLVLFAHVGPPPTEKHQAAHNDGNRTNNCIDNLRWATVEENHADKRRHGTVSRGEARRQAKLTDAAVRAIRADARFQRVIAKDYGVGQSVISQIKTRQAWSHVV